MVAQARYDVLHEGGGDLRRVHSHLHHRAGTGRGHVGVRVRQTLPQTRSALLVHRPRRQPVPDLGALLGCGEITGQRDVPLARAEGHLEGVEGVQQGGGSEPGGHLEPHVGAQTGLDLPRHGSLGHHEPARRRPVGPEQRLRGRHRITRAKSRAARSEPVTDPDTFDLVPSARG